MENVALVQQYIPLIPDQQFVIAASLVFLPSLYISHRTQPNNRVRQALTAVVILHSLWILRNILVHPSYALNVFTLLNVRLATPVKVLKGVCKARFGDAYAVEMDKLLDRFASFDLRTFYVRYGHSVILNCPQCHTQTDFAFFALTFLLPSYVLTTGVCALICCEANYRARWKTWVVCVIIAIGGTELWYTNFEWIDTRPGKATIMMHDVCTFLRHTVFLLLPPITHFYLPPSPPTKSPLATLVPAIGRLQIDTSKLNSLISIRQASSRNPELRERLMAHWERREEDSNGAMDDETVQAEAERLQIPYGEGPPVGMLRAKAQEHASIFRRELGMVLGASGT